MDRHAMEDLGIPGAVLMENAARSVADWVEENRLKNDREAAVVVCCGKGNNCLLYTSPSPRDGLLSRMPSSA